MLRTRILKKVALVLVVILFCEGCLQPVESDTKTEHFESSTPIVATASPDIAATRYSEQDKLSKTKGYLLYDETKEYASVKLYLKGVSKYKEYESVKCYLDETLVTEDTEVRNAQDYVLAFDIKEYIEKFNRIEVTSNGNSEIIDIGIYELERVSEAAISEKDKFELVSFETEDMINEFNGSFQLKGDLSKYEIQYYLPKQIQDMKMLNISSENQEGNFTFHSDCSRDDLKKQDLYSVEFDMYIMQVDKKTGDKCIISKCFIPLKVS